MADQQFEVDIKNVSALIVTAAKLDCTEYAAVMTNGDGRVVAVFPLSQVNSIILRDCIGK